MVGLFCEVQTNFLCSKKDIPETENGGLIAGNNNKGFQRV